VLDNDEDEDGDQLEITDVGNPSNGTAVAIDDDGDGVKDTISYTPSNSPDTVTFEYTISDGNGGTDTAEVTANVTGDESSCGPLTVRVEDPNGNLVPGVGFEPKYDGDNDGEPEQLPKRGMATGKFTYPVEVDDDPSLSKMNESLITEFSDGFATSVQSYEKDVEQASTPSGPQEEPDDFIYPAQDRDNTKSKLATDPSGNVCNDGEDNDGDGDVDMDDCNCADGDTGSESNGGSCGTTETYQGYGYQSCHFCHTGDAYTYIESFEADVTKTTNPDDSVDFSYDNEEYTGWNNVSGNSSACTQQIEEDTVSCYNRWTKAKGNNDSTWGPPGSYCKKSGPDSACYPNTDWPEKTEPSSPTCDSYTVIEPYPSCPPGTEKKVYGYDTCEKRCVRTSSP
jgi:hypothetical protein